MTAFVYLFCLALVASASGQESGQSSTHVRSYSQAAQKSLPPAPPPGPPTNAAPAAAAPVFSYAQAAKGPAAQQEEVLISGATTTAAPPKNAWGGGLPVPPTPPPRSYAQASNNNLAPQTAWGTRGGSAPAAPAAPPPARPTQPPRGSQHFRPTTYAPAAVAANVSDDDLRVLSDDLLRSDTNNAAASVRPNWQGRTYGSNPADLAPQPLLSIPRALQGATTTKMKQLFDNYEPDTAKAEVVTAYERDEDKAFLDAVMTTQVMAKTKKFLTDKKLIDNAPNAMRNKLQSLWFTMYPRLGGGSPVGSSAFEHVFLAEVKRGEISGFHNWLYFAHEENAGKADYLGHIRHIDLGGRGSVVKHHFKWGNITKPVGSMFIGTSPELEMALYTVCFLTRPDNRCPVRLGGEPFFIKTHSFTYRGAKYIGSAFPDI